MSVPLFLLAFSLGALAGVALLIGAACLLGAFLMRSAVGAFE
jgi:hypothetical protein